MKIKDFFNKLISGENNDVSSRRFTSLLSTGLIILVVLVAFFGVEIPEFMFWGLVTITLTTLGLTVIKP